jgi:multiple sugar transport system permease protein
MRDKLAHTSRKINAVRVPFFKQTLLAREARAGIYYVLPAVFLLLVFLVTPVILAFTLGFTDARLSSPNPIQGTGFENFSDLLKLAKLDINQSSGDADTLYDQVREQTKPGSGSQYEGMQILSETVSKDSKTGSYVLAGDPLFWKSLRNTVTFALVVAPLQGGLALLLALLVNSKLKGRVFFRTVYFLPVVTSMVVVSILWLFMYEESGLVNVVLSGVIPGYTPISFLGNTTTALPAIMVMSIWQGVGFHMLIWLSGLQTIPGELYEAAKVDGANAWKQFAHVTWPGLRKTFIFILVTISIAALGLFTQINVMTQGGPLDSTTTLVYHAYREGFRNQRIGYSSAIAIVFFAIVVTVSIVQRQLTKERD